ncbi:hypothetical protein Nepgr_033727 [Nepenthes gracilis]|uniref:Uncharacterized protein n=1 Tax=Nepenthes gracilis TaxID=150966 RepID=A0AAD3TMW8_NEPGR|nr:hypothetical protein Nepgr_033727 [Nepenthes gracilis]
MFTPNFGTACASGVFLRGCDANVLQKLFGYNKTSCCCADIFVLECFFFLMAPIVLMCWYPDAVPGVVELLFCNGWCGTMRSCCCCIFVCWVQLSNVDWHGVGATCFVALGDVAGGSLPDSLLDTEKGICGVT